MKKSPYIPALQAMVKRGDLGRASDRRRPLRLDGRATAEASSREPEYEATMKVLMKFSPQTASPYRPDGTR